MDVGIILGDVPVSTSAQAHLSMLLRQVEAAQRAGVRYITMGQHFLYDGYRWLQPIPTLARLAAEVSPETKLVTTVILLPLYHPVVAAEELATLDVVSEGRLIVGVGLGYRQSEFVNLGVEFDQRVERFEEALELMTRLWTEPHVRHQGRHFEVDGDTHITTWQQPRPPLWVGADSAAGVRRAARLGDAWVIGPNKDPDNIGRLVDVFGAERTRLGLPAATHPIRRDVAFGPNPDNALAGFAARTAARYRGYATNERSGYGAVSLESLARHVVHGTVEDCVTAVRGLASQLPIGPLIVRPQWPGMTTAEVVSYLDQLGGLVDGLRGLEPTR